MQNNEDKNRYRILFSWLMLVDKFCVNRCLLGDDRGCRIGVDSICRFCSLVILRFFLRLLVRYMVLGVAVFIF